MWEIEGIEGVSKISFVGGEDVSSNSIFQWGENFYRIVNKRYKTLYCDKKMWVEKVKLKQVELVEN